MPINLERVREQNKLLPADEQNYICSPRYLNPRSLYAEKWRQWLRTTPKDQRPPWLTMDLELMRGRPR